MFRRILVANRGEVAARVLRTCRRLGIETVAIASDADHDLSYLRLADTVVGIGPVKAYLDADTILHAGLEQRCSAVHPGWGFLSENATFAARCEAARLTFIGPRPLTMRRMGDKAVARATMKNLGLLPIPGSDGPVGTLDAARQAATQLGYPVLLKAVSGGGGRGMRKVASEGELAAAFHEATAEAAGAFGDASLYLEKLVEDGHHVEFQVVGDGRSVVVLGARECSVQRRHQKLLEETPPPGLSPEVTAEVAARLAQACEKLAYRGAGTVEMLQDGGGKLWFMEMNTRLQVEHTVTEEVIGVDLVEWQLRVAANERLASIISAGGAVPRPRGHAIQCRINAEDPTQGFRPTPGTIRRLVLPEGEGVRVDTHLAEGDRISPHYDSMFAKVITHGEDRTQAISRMKQALADLVVEGVPTTVALHQAVLDHPTFVSGHYDTRFLERELSALLP